MEDRLRILIEFVSVLAKEYFESYKTIWFWEDKTMLFRKTLEFHIPSHLFIGLWRPFKNFLNSFDSWELILKIPDW